MELGKRANGTNHKLAGRFTIPVLPLSATAAKTTISS